MIRVETHRLRLLFDGLLLRWRGEEASASTVPGADRVTAELEAILDADESPLGHGFLTGQIRTTDDFADDDWRKTNPRFMGENLERNLRIADEVAAVAAGAGATPAQVALAWLLHKGDDIVPIPGTKRTVRVEENCAADGIELSPEQIQRLDNLTPAAGGHHNEEQMRLLER